MLGGKQPVWGRLGGVTTRTKGLIGQPAEAGGRLRGAMEERRLQHEKNKSYHMREGLLKTPVSWSKKRLQMGGKVRGGGNRG